MDGDGSGETDRRMQVGDLIEVPPLGRLRITSVTQRNWSRVGEATDASNRRWFWKQFVDRVGNAHRRGLQGELSTREQLGQGEIPALEVVPLAGTVPDHLLLVFPHIPMATIDTIRQAHHRHRGPAQRVGQAMADIIEARRSPDGTTTRSGRGSIPRTSGGRNRAASGCSTSAHQRSFPSRPPPPRSLRQGYCPDGWPGPVCTWCGPSASCCVASASRSPT